MGNPMVESAEARSNVYRLLAKVFQAEPSLDLIRHLKTPAISCVLSDLGVSLEEDPRKRSERQLVDDLAIEFARLFVGPDSKLSPHESLHLTGDAGGGGYWGTATVQVKCFIEEAGLAYNSAFTGMPDHLSAELEFLEKMASWEAQQWSENNVEDARGCLRIQKRFIEEHLSRWAPDYCDKLMEATDEPFYRAIAMLTKEFVEYDRAAVDVYLAA